MYSTCLFCSGALGRNESIESFPVGRRLAFDAARGRLWVVCRTCARWNLTPLEARWEAIEEAERAYRDSRVRVATDQIGLAKLKDGLELVRIGSPLLPELATWRYGDVNRRRRQRAMVMSSVAVVAPLSIALATLVGTGASLGFAASALLTGMNFGNIVNAGAQWIWRRQGRIHLPVFDGRRIRILPDEALASSVVSHAESGSWSLRLMHPKHVIKGPITRSSDGGFRNPIVYRHTDLTGVDARRALSQIMPAVNREGAKEGSVIQASDLVSNNEHIRSFVNFGVVNRQSPFLRNGKNPLYRIPVEYRLALEMALHEEDERRAMDGELQALEERWREAEEIAGIADAMFVSPVIDERLGRIRKDQDSNSNNNSNVYAEDTEEREENAEG